jgi:hypothetical protein
MRRHNETLLEIAGDSYDAGTIRWAHKTGGWDRLRGPLGARSSTKKGRDANPAEPWPEPALVMRENAVRWAG